MKTRKLGNQGLTVSELGLGCMGISIAYGSADEADSLATISRALDLGITFLGVGGECVMFSMQISTKN